MYIYGHSPRSLITESLDVQSNQFILLCDVCEHSFCEQCFPVLQCEDCGLYKCGPCDEVKNTAALHVIFSSDLDEILLLPRRLFNATIAPLRYARRASRNQS
jgi:hypothetical protein